MWKKFNDEEYSLVSSDSSVNKIGADKIKEYHKFIGCKVRTIKKKDGYYDVYVRETYETPFTYKNYTGHSLANQRSSIINKFSIFGVTTDEKADEILQYRHYPEKMYDILLGFMKSYYKKGNETRIDGNKIYAMDGHFYPKQEAIVFLNNEELNILKKSKIPYKISNPIPDYIGTISVSMTVENARKLNKKFKW
jgi:hypothetical protein